MLKKIIPLFLLTTLLTACIPATPTPTKEPVQTEVPVQNHLPRTEMRGSQFRNQSKPKFHPPKSLQLKSLNPFVPRC